MRKLSCRLSKRLSKKNPKDTGKVEMIANMVPLITMISSVLIAIMRRSFTYGYLAKFGISNFISLKDSSFIDSIAGLSISIGIILCVWIFSETKLKRLMYENKENTNYQQSGWTKLILGNTLIFILSGMIIFGFIHPEFTYAIFVFFRKIFFILIKSLLGFYDTEDFLMFVDHAKGSLSKFVIKNIIINISSILIISVLMGMVLSYNFSLFFENKSHSIYKTIKKLFISKNYKKIVHVLVGFIFIWGVFWYVAGKNNFRLKQEYSSYISEDGIKKW